MTFGSIIIGILFTFDFFDVELQLNINSRKLMATKTEMISVILNNIGIGVKLSIKHKKRL